MISISLFPGRGTRNDENILRAPLNDAGKVSPATVGTDDGILQKSKQEKGQKKGRDIEDLRGPRSAMSHAVARNPLPKLTLIVPFL